MTETDEILYEVKDPGIAWLTFNRPEARNAMTFGMYDRLGEICRSINQDDSVKAVVLRGAGDKAFVSGTDISLYRGDAHGPRGRCHGRRTRRGGRPALACPV